MASIFFSRRENIDDNRKGDNKMKNIVYRVLKALGILLAIYTALYCLPLIAALIVTGIAVMISYKVIYGCIRMTMSAYTTAGTRLVENLRKGEAK